jgi:hypothetical protein
MSREGTCVTVNKQCVWKITAKDRSRELFLFPFMLAMILLCFIRKGYTYDYLSTDDLAIGCSERRRTG